MVGDGRARSIIDPRGQGTTVMGAEARDPRPNGSVGSTETADVRVFTLGYQGRSVREVLEIAQHGGIEQVIDVRENARSRKPGFSSSELERALASVGTAYVHLPTLGCERESRQAFWRGGATADFLDRYRRKVTEDRRSLEDLARLVRRSRSLLLCLERDPRRCHRVVLGEWLRAKGFVVQDL